MSPLIKQLLSFAEATPPNGPAARNRSAAPAHRAVCRYVSQCPIHDPCSNLVQPPPYTASQTQGDTEAPLSPTMPVTSPTCAGLPLNAAQCRGVAPSSSAATVSMTMGSCPASTPADPAPGAAAAAACPGGTADPLLGCDPEPGCPLGVATEACEGAS